MKLRDLFETEEQDDILEVEDMDISDALFILTEMADDGKLTENELKIIEEMLEKFLEDEDDDVELDEASKGLSRAKRRMYQRKYRKRAHVKKKEKKRAEANKKCDGDDKSAQLVGGPGSTSFSCKLKNRARVKLMKKVAKKYNM